MKSVFPAICGSYFMLNKEKYFIDLSTPSRFSALNTPVAPVYDKCTYNEKLQNK